MTWILQPPLLKRPLPSLILFCLAILASGAAQADKPAPNDEAPLVLKAFPIGELAFELVIAACHNDECPIEVLLLKGEAVVDRVKMPVAATSQDVDVENVDEAWGADPRLKGWGSGIEDNYVATTAQLIRLAPNQTGLLVDELDGFQVYKRQHVLLLTENGKLRKIWSLEEGQGPYWSATRVVPSQIEDNQDLVLFTRFRDPDPAKLDEVKIEKLHWEGALHQFKKTLLPDDKQPIYILQMGVYPTVASAQRANERRSECAHGLMMLRTTRYSGLPPGKVLLGDLYVNSSEAEATEAKIRNCSSRLNPSVVESFSRRRSSGASASHR